MKQAVEQLTRKPWVSVVLLTVLVAAAISCGGSGYGGGGNPTGPGGSAGGPKELNSGDIAPGGTYIHRFANAGTFRYHCIHHSVMTGTVTVNDAAVDTLVNVSIVSFTQPFHSASVKPGGRVRWTNNNNMVHTVTSN